MNSEIPEFLRGLRSQIPAEFDFGDPVAETARALDAAARFPLQHRAVLRVTGSDADAFLQGQLSSDLRALTDSAAQWSSCNSPKGRTLALPILRRSVDGVDLDLPRGLLEPLRERLQRYLLRSRVSIQADDGIAIGMAGPKAEAMLATVGLPVPQGAMAIQRKSDLVVTRLPGDPPRFTLHVDATSCSTTWEALGEAGATPAGSGTWTCFNVMATLPEVYPQTSDQFIPQHLGLEPLGALSWDKGCYTGQEVIARLHYRGETKRGLRRLHTRAPPPPPGAVVESGDGGSAGEVVESALHPMRGTVLTAVLRLDVEGPLRLRQGGADLEIWPDDH